MGRDGGAEAGGPPLRSRYLGLEIAMGRSRLRGRGIDGDRGGRQHVAEHEAEGASRRGARPPSLRLSRCTDSADRSVGRDPRTPRRVGEAKHAEKKGKKDVVRR